MHGGCIFRRHGNGSFTLECVISRRALVKPLPLWWLMGTSDHVIHSNSKKKKSHYVAKQNSYGQSCNRNSNFGQELQRPDDTWHTSFMRYNCSYRTDLCQMSWNLGASTSMKPSGPIQAGTGIAVTSPVSDGTLNDIHTINFVKLLWD